MQYVIFGAGRVGANMDAYLRSLGHEVALITRAQAENERVECEKMVGAADIVAAAIPDGKLNGWLDDWKGALNGARAAHFSGAVHIEGMSGFHALYSFPKTVVDPSIMKAIPFACPENGPAFADVFPGAPNPHFILADKDRARYHALAVLGGNLPAYLWNQISSELGALSGMAPADVMGAYLQSLTDRFLESPGDSLTGPIARRDKETVNANLNALQDAPDLTALYKTFLKTAWPDFEP